MPRRCPPRPRSLVKQRRAVGVVVGVADVIEMRELVDHRLHLYHTVMACIVMAYMLMAYIVMAYVVMADIVMASLITVCTCVRLTWIDELRGWLKRFA